MSDEFKAELWTYLGRRELGKGGLGNLWLDEAGEKLLYGPKLKAHVVGARYEVQVARDLESVRAGSPVFKEQPDDDRVPHWEAEDRAAYTADELRRMEQRARREAPDRFGQLTLAELKALYLKQPAARSAALLAQTIRYLGGA